MRRGGILLIIAFVVSGCIGGIVASSLKKIAETGAFLSLGGGVVAGIVAFCLFAYICNRLGY